MEFNVKEVSIEKFRRMLKNSPTNIVMFKKWVLEYKLEMLGKKYPKKLPNLCPAELALTNTNPVSQLLYRRSFLRECDFWVVGV